MEEQSRKKVAAVTAVLYYLQEEQESVPHHMAGIRQASPASDGFWSFSGRQSQMILRSMAQMRLFPGWRG